MYSYFTLLCRIKSKNKTLSDREGFVFIRRITDHLFEQPAQMVRIFEAQFVGDFADRFAAFDQEFLGTVDGGQLDVLLRRFSGLLLDQIAEIVGRQVQPVGAPRQIGRAHV